MAMRIKYALILVLALPWVLATVQGCTHAPQPPVYEESKFLKPMPAGLMVGPPIVGGNPEEEASLAALVRPLPPVLLISGRNLYLFAGVYYYYWDGDWWFSGNRTGPWYLLQKKYHPALEIIRPYSNTPFLSP